MKTENTAQSVAPDPAQPERYDFGRPAALSRESTRALAGAFDAFARQWAMQLTAKIRLRAHIALDGVTLETYDEYVATVPPTTTLVVCGDGDDSDERGIIEFPLPTALSWIVKMVGGGDTTAGADGRTLTPVEQALLRVLMDETLAHLRGSLGPLMPQGFGVSALQYNAAFAQIASPRDLVIVARFSMKFADRVEAASIALPAAGLLERLSRTTADPFEVPDPDTLRREIEEVPVEVTLRMSPQNVLPEAVLNLAVGDVITLAHSSDKPLDLAIGDHVVAAAAVGANGTRLACSVTSSDMSPSHSEDSK